MILKTNSNILLNAITNQIACGSLPEIPYPNNDIPNKKNPTNVDISSKMLEEIPRRDIDQTR